MGISLNNLRAFIAENEAFFDSIRSQICGSKPIDMSQLKRDLHNLKGTLSLYSFSICVSLLHEIESEVNLLGSTKDLSQLESLFSQLSEHYEKDLKNLNSQAELFFEKYQRYLNTLSAKSGYAKKVLLEYHPDSCELIQKDVQHLERVLGHIFRNCFDHGIETEGKIIVLATRDSMGCLTFTISDDGKGIRFEDLAALAVKKKIWTQAKADSACLEEKIDLIFVPGISTQTQVSETSGRGIGMDAVKSYLLSVGGSISIHPGQPCGTEVVIQLPDSAAIAA